MLDLLGSVACWKTVFGQEKLPLIFRETKWWVISVDQWALRTESSPSEWMTHSLRTWQRNSSENHRTLFSENVHWKTIVFMKMSFVKIIVRRKTQYPAPIIKVSHSRIQIQAVDSTDNDYQRTVTISGQFVKFIWYESYNMIHFIWLIYIKRKLLTSLFVLFKSG